MCFICCGLEKGPRSGFGWNGGSPGRRCEESPTGGLPGTRPLPCHQGYPMLCHSQGPVPPVPQAWLLLGALPLSSALSSSAHPAPWPQGCNASSRKGPRCWLPPTPAQLLAWVSPQVRGLSEALSAKVGVCVHGRGPSSSTKSELRLLMTETTPSWVGGMK